MCLEYALSSWDLQKINSKTYIDMNIFGMVRFGSNFGQILVRFLVKIGKIWLQLWSDIGHIFGQNWSDIGSDFWNFGQILRLSTLLMPQRGNHSLIVYAFMRG